MCKRIGVNACSYLMSILTVDRAGELTPEELERLTKVITDPRSYKIPDWFLNRQKDIKDGKYSQVISSALDSKLRDDFERMKKIRYSCSNKSGIDGSSIASNHIQRYEHGAQRSLQSPHPFLQQCTSLARLILECVCIDWMPWIRIFLGIQVWCVVE